MDNGANLYERFLGGDSGAFEMLVDEYKYGLTLYLNSIVGNIFTAEELMEESFFRLIDKRPHFSGKSSFKTFLYAIGRNAAAEYLRKNRRSSPHPIEAHENELIELGSVEAAVIRDEWHRAVRRAMDKLNDEQKQAVYLTYFEEMTADEAARVVKKSRHAVENLVYRAKKALKTELEREGFNDENRL